jgi:hypothetical protein
VGTPEKIPERVLSHSAPSHRSTIPVKSSPSYRRTLHLGGFIDLIGEPRPATKTVLKPTPAPGTCNLQARVFDGTRELFTARTGILYRIIDANQKQVYIKEKNNALVSFTFEAQNNFLDNYTFVASAKGYKDAGFTPVKLDPVTPVTLDLMLLPKDASFNFADATWDAIKNKLPFLANGVDNAAGKQRYEDLIEDKPESLAALLNITTAMGRHA